MSDNRPSLRLVWSMIGVNVPFGLLAIVPVTGGLAGRYPFPVYMPAALPALALVAPAAFLIVCVGIIRRLSWARVAAVSLAIISLPYFGFGGQYAGRMFVLIMAGMEGSHPRTMADIVFPAVGFALGIMPSIVIAWRLTRQDMRQAFGSGEPANG